jgi:hypothetical protein
MPKLQLLCLSKILNIITEGNKIGNFGIKWLIKLNLSNLRTINLC